MQSPIGPARPGAYSARMEKSPIRPADDEARTLARRLLADARHGALAFTHPQSGAPFISRIALGLSPDGTPMSLLSTLALHTLALRRSGACALLLGEPPAKGDALAFPRLSLSARAEFAPRRHHGALREHWLKTHPKAKLYVDFADFGFVLFHPTGAALNGGFGKAWELGPEDLA